MGAIADIFRLHGPAYRAKFGNRILPSHLRAMQAIEACRTETLGGHVYYCEACQESHYRYHSCKNRHCPTCQHDTAHQWLAQQRALLLPVPHFLVTCTLPEELREVARSHQHLLYTLLFRSAAAALQKLAGDPRFIGGTLGMVGVLHTWTRDLRYHPHVHYLVPGGGLSADGHTWLPSRADFLVPVEALSQIYRAKFRDALQQTPLFARVPPALWAKDWVVHSEPVGTGVAALRYLARYLFRVAITDRRILQWDDAMVTFTYKDAGTRQTKDCTVTAEEFLRRFLQHVLPSRFVKVRYYGLFSPRNRHVLQQAQTLLGVGVCAQPPEEHSMEDHQSDAAVRCPTCGSMMILIQTVRPTGRWPP